MVSYGRFSRFKWSNLAKKMGRKMRIRKTRMVRPQLTPSMSELKLSNDSANMVPIAIFR